MEPEKIHDIEEITAMHLPKKQSEGYWYDNADSDIRNYITGRDDLSLSGIGRFGLKRAKNEYMSLGNTFRRRSLSAPEMAKYENKYHIDQSLFDVARDEIGRDYNIDAEKYQTGRMSDRRWNRKSQRYDQQIKNLNENQYILDQQQNPLRYARPHQRGDTAPLLFSLGFPLAFIGGAEIAPYIGKFLANPWVQRGLTGLDVVDTGIQVASGNYLGAAANWIPYDKVLSMFKKLKYAPNNIKERAKNLYNRYTAPRTSIKHTPYKGDQHQLAKFRLINGGFDKLGITPDDVVYVPKTHPMATPVNSSSIVNSNNIATEEPINARKFLLKSEPKTLRTPVAGTAYYDFGEKVYTQPTFGKYGKLDMNTKTITSHEYQHAIDDVVAIKNQPVEVQASTYLNDDLTTKPRIIIPPGTDTSKISKDLAEYFQTDEGTELHARLAQLKNWYGITDPNKPITPKMWNYARRHYVPSMGLDNNMQQMFRFVTDPKKFLDWINPRVASQAGIVGTAGLSIINNENNKNIVK